MSETDYIEKDITASKHNRVAGRVGLAVFITSLVAALIIVLVIAYYRGVATDRLGLAVNDLRTQVVDCKDKPPGDPDCQTPVAPEASTIIEGVPGPTGQGGPKGDVGPAGPGPSDAQVARAVAAYCEIGACDGNGPTRDQVADAVATYCDENGLCRGPKGESVKGDPGERGDKGDTGAQGPGPTTAHIDLSVESYCAAHNDCKGPPGQDGANGQPGDNGTNGTDGRGITSIDCTGLGVDTLTIHYTDGSEQIVPCA